MQIDQPISKTEKPVLTFIRQSARPLWQAGSLMGLYFLATSCAVQQGNPIWDPLEEKSVTDTGINRSIKSLSPAIAALVKQADVKIEQKQWSQAISIIERALRINPKQAEAWTRMAIAHLGSGNAEQAIHMARRANVYAAKNLKLKSYNWLLISRAYKKLNKPDAAKSAAFKSKKIMQENN